MNYPGTVRPACLRVFRVWLGVIFAFQALVCSAGVLQCTYDAAGRLTAIRNDASTNVTYLYDSSGSMRQTSTFAATTADLAVVADSVPATPLAGMSFELLMTVANLTSAGAPSARLNGELPAQLVLLSISSSKGSCSVEGTQLTCDLGTLNPGEHAVVRLSLVASASGQFPVNFTVASANDPSPANNNSLAPLAIQPPAALNFQIGRVGAGESQITWPAEADGLVLEETSDLSPPVTWLATEPPSLTGDVFRVPVTLGAEDKFYRLRRAE